MKRVKLAVAVVVLLCAWAGSAAPAPGATRELPLTPSKHDALYRALVQGQLSEPRYALERARSLFALERVRREFGHVARPDPHAATFILRDLVARLRFLSGQDRLEARALLARPDGVPSGGGEPTWEFDAIPSSTCEVARPLCFHWDDNASNRDSPPAADTNPADGIPDQVDLTMSVLDNVWDTEVTDLGYRAPLGDSTTTLNDGGGPQLDIYLTDLGGFGLFGYCTTDDPHAFAFTAPWDVSAYCVLDDDYRPSQFGTGQTPEEFLDVTAAHEFFHAVQFAYDWFEDFALMEGTAMWMEGQVYPAVIDRINYLNRSALSKPAVPLDIGTNGYEYGAWLFWRFLSEKVFGNDPTIIREIWERADGSAAAAFGDEYSFQAVKRALPAHGFDFRRIFARFGWTNDLRDYAEASLGYPVVPIERSFRFGKRRHSTGWQSVRIRHLSTYFYRLRPGRGVGRHASLRLRVDLPDLRTGPAATAVLYRKGAPVEVRSIPLGTHGGGHRTLDFGRADVRKIDLVLSNGSLRFNCPPKDFPESLYSCGGFSKDDRHMYRFRGRVQ